MKEKLKELFLFKNKYTVVDFLFAHFIIFLILAEIIGWMFLTRAANPRPIILDIVFSVIPIISIGWIHVATVYKTLINNLPKS